MCGVSAEGTLEAHFGCLLTAAVWRTPGTGMEILSDPCQPVSLVDIPSEYLHSLKQTWHTHSSGMEADEEVPDVSFRSGRFPASVVPSPWRRESNEQKCIYLN